MNSAGAQWLYCWASAAAYSDDDAVAALAATPPEPGQSNAPVDLRAKGHRAVLMNNRWENPHTDDLAVLQAWALERRAYLKTVLAAGPLPRVVQSSAIASSDAESDTADNVDIGGAHPDPLGAIQAELDSLWLTHPHVPDDVRTQMSIAAAEIGANIIEHTGGRQPVRMRMGSELAGDQVHVTFTDDGPPVDIDLASVTMPDATAERGRGLAMAQTVLDQLAYRCDDLGNQWTLVSKRFG